MHPFFLSIPVWTPEQDSLVVAVSGGIDSMVLLDLLRTSGYPIAVVAHVRHGFREDDVEDEALVQRYCEEFKISFVSTCLDTPTGKRSEAWAREERYRFLEEVRRKVGAKWIVTAHHQDDLVETIILHMSRGAGLHGLQGMHAVHGNILRPLLGVSKRMLQNYASDQQIPYREDITNEETTYKRNAVRTLLLPTWKTIVPDIEQKLLGLGTRAQDWEDYHRSLVHEHPCWQEWSADGSCDRQEWNAMHRIWQENFLREVVRTTVGTTQGIYAEELTELIRWIRDGRSGTEKKLGTTCTFVLSTKRMYMRQEETVTPPLSIADESIHTWGNWKIHIVQKEQGAVVQEGTMVGMDELPCWEVRSWQPGDRFHPLGMSGQQKVSDFFVNTKVPKHVRPQIPILTTHGRIVLVGNRCDEWYRVREGQQFYYHILCYEDRD